MKPRSRGDGDGAPVGCVTLAFTDVEGSTELWEQAPETMRLALAVHDRVLRTGIARHGGYEVKTEGDAFMVAFGTPMSAVAWCLEVQAGLIEAPWPEQLERSRAAACATGPDGTVVLRGLRVRMGVHLGFPECRRDGLTGRMDYFGPVVNRAARVAAAAHGGQVLVSGAVGDEVHSALLARGDELRVLGEHLVKGVAEPLRIDEVVGREVRGRIFPPIRAAGAPRSNLRAETTSFVGRDGELDAVKAALERGHRLLTLLGPAGAGKTRLAVEAGLRHVQGAGSQAWFCDLSSAATPERLLAIVARTLGVALAAGRSEDEALDQLGRALAARGPALVILDNLEQVAADAARAVQRWLQAAPQASFLATSREPLGLGSELRLEVAPLGVDEGVRLFEERARTAAPGFTLGDEGRRSASELVRRLDGLPLAIELAAARSAVLTPRQLLEQLGRRFDLLASRRRDLTPRQASLRGALDWSWELLAADEQRALAALSVFRSGFTLAGATAVLEGPSALDLVQSLREKSLLRSRTLSQSSRFDAYEAVRDYGAERLAESGAEADARARHAAFCLALAGCGVPEPGVLRTYDEAYRSLAPEVDEVMAAAAWCRGADPATAVRLALALGPVLVLEGRLAAFEEMARLAVGAAQTLGDAALFGEARNHLSAALGLLGRLDESLKEALRALEPARRAGSPALLARVLGTVGGAHLMLLHEAPAETALAESLDVARAAGVRTTVLRALLNLAALRFRQGRHEEARRATEEGLGLAERWGERWAVGAAQGYMAFTLTGLGRHREAATHYREALRLHRAEGEWRLELEARGNLAFQLMLLGEPAPADDGDLLDDLQRCRAAGHRWGELGSHVTLGSILLGHGQAEAAAAHFDEAIALSRACGDDNFLGLCTSWLAACRAELGDPDGAAPHLARARELLGPVHAEHLELLDGLVALARARAARPSGGPEEASARALLAARDAPGANPGDGDVALARSLLRRALARGK